jgi:hypothetical protein
VLQPMPPNARPLHRAFTGKLKGAMYRAGVVHHFRIVDADAVLWLVPPTWLSPHSLQVATMAFDPLDAQFLHILRTVDHDLIWDAMRRVMALPDGMTSAEMVAQMRQRKLEVVQ